MCCPVDREVVGHAAPPRRLVLAALDDAGEFRCQEVSDRRVGDVHAMGVDIEYLWLCQPQEDLTTKRGDEQRNTQQNKVFQKRYPNSHRVFACPSPSDIVFSSRTWPSDRNHYIRDG
jgi:hypothetical protein